MLPSHGDPHRFSMKCSHFTDEDTYPCSDLPHPGSKFLSLIFPVKPQRTQKRRSGYTLSLYPDAGRVSDTKRSRLPKRGKKSKHSMALMCGGLLNHFPCVTLAPDILSFLDWIISFRSVPGSGATGSEDVALPRSATSSSAFRSPAERKS